MEQNNTNNQSVILSDQHGINDSKQSRFFLLDATLLWLLAESAVGLQVSAGRGGAEGGRGEGGLVNLLSMFVLCSPMSISITMARFGGRPEHLTTTVEREKGGGGGWSRILAVANGRLTDG